jgi:hypothetical protein
MMPHIQGKLQAKWTGGWSLSPHLRDLRSSATVRIIRFTPFITAGAAEERRDSQRIPSTSGHYRTEARLTFATESISNADCGANHGFSTQAKLR